MRIPGHMFVTIVVLFLAAVVLAEKDDDLYIRQVGSSSSSSSSNRCTTATFARLLPFNARVEKVEAVSAGDTYGEGTANKGYPIQPTNLPELCAVTIAVRSSSISSYRFGIFLPTEWNARFLAVGNGGFSGGINWLDMGAGVHYGFSVLSTDTGHNSIGTDLSWALGNNETKMDWGWRAMHGSVSLGKLCVAAYYGRSISHSYYSGCSTGGRQGLKEVQISPDSFDGVLVGAPSWDTAHGNTWVSKVATYNWPDTDPKHIDWRLLRPIANEILKQCDDIDGVADGIISLAEQCTVDFGRLLCTNPAANQSACLSDAQTKTLKNVYSDYVASETGEDLFVGLSPGSETQSFAVLNYSDSSPYGIGYVRYFLLDDPDFSLADFNDSIPKLAERLDPGGATANEYDIASFRDKGGKMIVSKSIPSMYHGMADGLVPIKESNTYYSRVAAATSNGNATKVAEFFRYFMVPGMQHCFTTATDAAWAFGGAAQTAFFGNDTWSVPGFEDAQHDILLALVDWVETGVPVDQVVATTWTQQTNTSSGVLRQRPICPYPQMARYDGEGDADDARSWACGGDVSTTGTVPVTGSGSSALWQFDFALAALWLVIASSITLI